MRDLTELLELESFKIAGEEFDFSHFRESIGISDNVNEAFLVQPQLQAIYGFAFEQALAYSAKLETDLDRLYALCDQRVRAQAVAVGVKITEKMVENDVITSSEYQELQNQLQEAKHQAGMLKAALRAIESRKDALVSISANYRQEANFAP